MSIDHTQDQPGGRSTSRKFLSASLREDLEQAVSSHLGRSWAVRSFTDLDDFASHPCAILSDNTFPIFVKLSEAANALDQFEIELAGLRYLAQPIGVLIPTPIGNMAVEGGFVMVQEAAQAVERNSSAWRQIGQTLARIHQTRSDSCGFEIQGYFGPLYQDNRPMRNWLEFFIERRMWPRLMGAIESGSLSTTVIRQIESLIKRLPGMGLPDVIPTLLHGDAQQNNFISTSLGAMVIDPAVHFGNPEMDLAYIDYFQTVPNDFFDGYRQEMQIAPGFSDRRDLWRIPAYLAAVTVEGAVHLDKLMRAVGKYM